MLTGSHHIREGSPVTRAYRRSQTAPELACILTPILPPRTRSPNPAWCCRHGSCCPPRMPASGASSYLLSRPVPPSAARCACLSPLPHGRSVLPTVSPSTPTGPVHLPSILPMLLGAQCPGLLAAS